MPHFTTRRATGTWMVEGSISYAAGIGLYAMWCFDQSSVQSSAQSSAQSSVQSTICAMVVACAVMGGVAARMLVGRDRAVLGRVAVWGVCLVAGMGNAHLRWRLRPSVIATRPACHVRHVLVRHVLASTHHVLARVVAGPVAAGMSDRYRMSALQLRASSGETRHLCGTIDVFRPVSESVSERKWQVGQVVWLWGQLRPAQPARIDGSVGGVLRDASEDIGARMVIAAPYWARADARDADASSSWRHRAHHRILTAVARATDGNQAIYAILSELILGQSTTAARAASDEIRPVFNAAGLAHILAVSGFHLTLITGCVYLALTAALRFCAPCFGSLVSVSVYGPILVAIFSLVVAVAYTALTGASSATLRACCMAVCFFSARVFGRRGDAARALGLSAWLLLIWDPLDLFRPGFQLSFVACIALLLLSRPERLSFHGFDRLKLFFAANAVATFSTTAIAAHHFGIVPTYAYGANLLAIPWASFLLMPAGFLAALISLFSINAAVPMMEIAAWAAALLFRFCAWIGLLKSAQIVVTPTWAVTSAIVAMTFAAAAYGRVRRMMVCAAVICGCIACAQWIAAQYNEDLIVHFLDVGQGDAALLQTPSGQAILIDGGPPSQRADAHRVVRFLRSKNIARLDVAIVSHPHADHVGGILAVLQTMQVDQLWLCTHDKANSETDVWVRQLLSTARQKHTSVKWPRIWQVGPLKLTRLWPSPAPDSVACATAEHSVNDNSFVIRVDYGRSSLLFPGDIESAAEDAILAQYRGTDALPVNVLKVAHHGSRTSSTADFLSAVRPSLAIISSGIANRFGLPHQATLDRLKRMNIDTRRVDDEGSILLRLSPTGKITVARGYGVIP